MRIDINCDMGEGIGNDEEIMPYITSANIACGLHAGDDDIMERTLLLARDHSVHIGAHPSFEDRENFGRTEIHLAPQAVFDLVRMQVEKLYVLAKRKGTELHHVKPHGALYNMAAKNSDLAAAISTAIKDVDDRLLLYGLSNSHLIHEGRKAGLPTASEAFADRSYQDDGSLTPRSFPGALINDETEMLQHVERMLKGKVRTVSGKEIPILAETICVHGDGAHALAFARSLHHHFKK